MPPTVVSGPDSRGGRRRLRGAARGVAAGVLITLATLGVGMMPTPGAAAPAIMPAHAIAAGMTGVGKTVIIGTSVVQFNVRVLGVLHNAGPGGDLVLFRASGPVIQSVGGIAAGMSGSPIYLQGKLAGALSYTFAASDPMVGLFTPIEDMLRMLPAAAHGGRPGAYALAPTRLDGRTVRRVIIPAWGAPPAAVPSGHLWPRAHGFHDNIARRGVGERSQPCPQAQGRTAPRRGGDALVAVPAATPLLVSGFGGAGLEALTHVLAPMGLTPVAGGSEANVPASLPLEPGSAIGVALLKGDIAAYAIGTMTYRDGNRMLAFGHPFTGIGPVSYLLMNATILQIVQGQQQNIKIGAVGSPVGIISQDRPAGIGGTIGVMPRMFGVHVHVTDGDSGVGRDFNFQVIPSTQIAPVVVPVGSQGAIERALNRSGPGTATVRMVLYGRGLPKPVVRENMFYGASGIAGRALAELPQAMSLLFDNDFKDVGPTAIDLDVRVTSAQQTATIVEAEVPHDPVAPGDTVHVRVTVRPFRAAPQTQDVALVIPANAVAGPATLVVRAGGTGLPRGAGGMAASAQAGQGAGPRTLADAIKAFETGDKNTDVVVELMGGVPPRTGTAGAAPARPSGQWTTPWVVHGRVLLPVVIKGGTH
ncbi:MAG TPA: SpoIVB peptidase S55 domain-containing protein [bacterium]|nr:SpoIVB peptidase S55 domain-containing protein [bacterium]